MRLTIINDGTVSVDGVAFVVDVSGLPADFHALQWEGDRGEIEYNMTMCEHCRARSKKPNATIFDVTPYQRYVDAWNVAKTTADARAAEARRLAEAEYMNMKAPDAAG